ncbi:hypothetical protein RB195_011822 [Necator americanus]|uniref:Uncharacterized protein n=1 Tax=Necator americanus TaxID=51031 RepID=A0ABR1D4A7_NECAM
MQRKHCQPRESFVNISGTSSPVGLGNERIESASSSCSVQQGNDIVVYEDLIASLHFGLKAILTDYCRLPTSSG